MTNHDKDEYRGPISVPFEKEPPKPWKLEMDRDKIPIPTKPKMEPNAILSMAAQAGLKVSFVSRTDA